MANLLSGQVFPFDPTGKLASNKITNEFHVITAANWRSYHFIVPKKAPYFEDSLVMTYRNASGVVVNLQKGVDWVPSYWFVGASRACAKNIYGGVTFLNAKLAGNIEISYQTIGGEWVLDDTAISEILANRLNNPINTTWEVIANVPKVFPPVPHEWDLIDMVGEEEVVQAIHELRDTLVIKTGATSGSGNHLTDYKNPHQVTKAQVGLGNVNNFGAMPLTEAGSNSNELYTTPASVRILIENALGSAFRAFKDRTDNPHNVTASQVGTYTRSEIDAKLNTKLSETAIAFDSARFNGMSYQELKSDILSGTAGNAMTLNGRTLDQIVESIQAAVTNGSTFGGYTPEELKAWVLSGVADNSTKFNGRTDEQFVEWLNTNRKINANQLNGKSYTELKDDVLAGTAANTNKFNNMTPEAFAAFVKRTNGTDASSLSGKNLEELIADIRAMTVDNANKVYGLTLEQLREQIQGTADNANKIAGKTYEQAKADILSGTADNANKLSGKTLEQITESIQATVNSNLTYGGRTLDELKAWILSGDATNSIRFNGKTEAEFLEWLNTKGKIDAGRLDGKTYQQVKTDILSGTVDNASKLEGKTLGQIIESIQAAVTSGSTFGGYTPEQFKAWVLNSEVENSTKFNGRDEDQFAEWLNDNRKINADRLNGKNYAELKADVLTGTAANAGKFNNMTPEVFAAYVKQVNGTDADTLSGSTLQNVIDEARRGTVANANKVYGLTLEQLREQIQGTADNANKIAGKTYEQAKADILTGTAANANTVGGRTVDEIITLASANAGGSSSDRAYGRTLEQLKSFILAGKAGDSTRFDGKSYTEVKEDIKNYVKQDSITRLIINSADGTTANRRRNYHIATINPAYINNSRNSQTGVIHVFGALSDNAFKALDNNTTAAEGNTSHLEMMILLNGKKLAAGEYTTCLTVEASVYNKAALPSGTTDERILEAVKNSYKFYFKADTATSTVKLYMTCEDRHQDITVLNSVNDNEFIKLADKNADGFSNTAENAAGMIAASYLPVIGKLDPAANTVNETTVNSKVAAAKSELTSAINSKATAERTQSNNLYAPKTALTALQTADNNMLAMITRGNIGDVIITSNSANNIIDFNQSMCHEVTLPGSGTVKIDFRAKPLGTNFTFTADQSGVTEYGLLTVVTGATLPVVQWENNNTDTGILFSSGQAPVLAKNKTYVFNIIGMVDKTAPNAFKRVIINLLCSY